MERPAPACEREAGCRGGRPRVLVGRDAGNGFMGSCQGALCGLWGVCGDPWLGTGLWWGPWGAAVTPLEPPCVWGLPDPVGAAGLEGSGHPYIPMGHPNIPPSHPNVPSGQRAVVAAPSPGSASFVKDLPHLRNSLIEDQHHQPGVGGCWWPCPPFPPG